MPEPTETGRAVTAYGGPRCGEAPFKGLKPYQVNNILRCSAWKGYVATWDVAGNLLTVVWCDWAAKA